MSSAWHMVINTQYTFIISNKTISNRLYQRERDLLSASLKRTKWYCSLRVVGNIVEKSVQDSWHGIYS